MRALLLLILWILPGLAHAANEPPQKLLRWIPPRIEETSQESDGKRMWTGISGEANFSSGGLYGGGISAGYQFHTLGMDLRTRYSKAGFGAISPPPSPGDLYRTPVFPSKDPNTGLEIPVAPETLTPEVQRARKASDPWAIIEVEPGVSITANLFRNFLPLLTQRARLGLAYAQMTDQQNGLTFNGFLMSFDGALQYQLQARRPFAVELGVNWHVGQVTRSDRPAERESQLPISYITSALSLVYWF